MKLKSILLLSAGILALNSSYAQSYVTTAGQKYTLLEEGTGMWCGYCPDGSQRIQQTIEPANPHFIAIAWHNGDALTLSPDDFNTTYIGGSAGPGWPGGAVDRTVFTHDYGASAGGIKTRVGHNRGFWSTDVTAQSTTTPKFDVKMTSTYDSSTTGATARLVTVKVTAKALVAGTGSWRINAIVIEDSLSGSTYPQNSYMYGTSGSWFYNKCVGACPGYPTCTDCSLLPDTVYSHMGVVRKVLATGGSMWGDSTITNPAVGDSITKTYTYTIPASSPSKYIRVVGVVGKYGTATTDRAIENCIVARVRTMWKVYPTPSTEVAEVSGAMENVEVSPNPAANFINVHGSLYEPTATKITITNSAGSVVTEKEYPAGGTMFSENISLNSISNGIYFMNITNNGASITKKFIVNK